MVVTSAYTHTVFDENICEVDQELGSGEFTGGVVTCCWPLKAPTPLQSILWPIIDPILVTFGQICNFCDPNLVAFYLCIYHILNGEHFTFHPGTVQTFWYIC